MNNHRSKVGPPGLYDVIGAQQFCIAVQLGLREHHHVLDVGCGSLRGSRFFIQYLLPKRWVGIEPDVSLVADGIEFETGRDIHELKKTEFHHMSNFELVAIGRDFDFVLAQSILSHAGWDVVEKIFRQVRRVLVPNGKFLATFFVGEYGGSEGWLGNGVESYSEGFMERTATRNRMTFNTLNYDHPMGQTWFVASKVTR